MNKIIIKEIKDNLLWSNSRHVGHVMPYVVYVTVCYLYFRLNLIPPNFKT
jgi:hypothetical protein